MAQGQEHSSWDLGWLTLQSHTVTHFSSPWTRHS